jgi:hypothetical protein
MPSSSSMEKEDQRPEQPLAAGCIQYPYPPADALGEGKPKVEPNE